MAGWRPNTPPINPTSTRCRECDAELELDAPTLAGGFCSACTAAIRLCQSEPQAAAVEIWTRVAEKVPGDSAATFALIYPVAVGPAGELVCTARRSIRRWVLRRYGDWFEATAGTEVQILPPQRAAGMLALRGGARLLRPGAERSPA